MPPRAYTIADSGLNLAVRLTPKGGRDAIDGLTVDADGRVWLAVRVSAPPDAGKANTAMVKLLAKRLGVAQGTITLVAGATQRLKRLRVEGNPRDLAQTIDDLSRGSG